MINYDEVAAKIGLSREKTKELIFRLVYNGGPVAMLSSIGQLIHDQLSMLIAAPYAPDDPYECIGGEGGEA